MGFYTNELAQYDEQYKNATLPERTKEQKKYKPVFNLDTTDEAVITSARVTLPPWTEKTGDSKLYLEVELTHPISDRSTKTYLTLQASTDGQAAWVKKELLALGYDLNDENNTLAGVEDYAPTLIGNRVEVYTKENTYNGKTNYKYYINKTIEASASGPIMSDDDIPF